MKENCAAVAEKEMVLSTTAAVEQLRQFIYTYIHIRRLHAAYTNPSSGCLWCPWSSAAKV